MTLTDNQKVHCKFCNVVIENPRRYLKVQSFCSSECSQRRFEGPQAAQSTREYGEDLLEVWRALKMS